ncbi:HAD family hydrolase [Mesorhizobium sp. ZMM04-5]|uniref:HAD family hydrolase n=1 Tax=Mesorhizobium marinum TaxID=3228790 RepID=A0ABV3R0Z3_9HYPH
MPQPDLVIFDFDGVLVDSEIIAARVEAEMITQAGYEITGAELSERYAGLTFKDIMLKIEEVAAIPFQASLIDQAEAMVDQRLRADVRAIEGAREAVASVAANRCICSNSRAERIGFMAEKTGLAPFFAGRIYSSLETPTRNPKPAPDVFLHAAATLGANPRNSFVVEDSVHGIAGAKAAGMRVIGFTGASHSYPGHADALTEAGAETVIRRWADFPGVLAALSEWSA